jgi:hypothetical protein
LVAAIGLAAVEAPTDPAVAESGKAENYSSETMRGARFVTITAA